MRVVSKNCWILSFNYEILKSVFWLNKFLYVDIGTYVYSQYAITISSIWSVSAASEICF